MRSTSRSGCVKSSPRHSRRGCLRFCETTSQPTAPRGTGARVGWRSGHGRLGSQDGRSAARARLDRVGASTCPVLSAEGGASRVVAARRSRRRPRASTRHSCFSCFAPTDERGRSIGRAGRRFSGDRQGDWPAAPVSRIGASAGLNTIWDRYHYRLGAVGWGDPQSPVSLAPGWEGPSPPVDVPLRVIERHACDIALIDLEDPAQRLRLRAYIWADQRERLSRLESAIDLARAHGPRVDQADAADWIRAKLREPAARVATVFYHSVMWGECRRAPRRLSRRASSGPAIVRPTPRLWPGCGSNRLLPRSDSSFA